MANESMTQNSSGQRIRKIKSTSKRLSRPPKRARRGSYRVAEQEGDYDEDLDEGDADELSIGEYGLVQGYRSRNLVSANSEARLPQGKVDNDKPSVEDLRSLYTNEFNGASCSVVPASRPSKGPLPKHFMEEEKDIDDSLVIPVLEKETLKHEKQTVRPRSSQRHSEVKAESGDEINMNNIPAPEHVVKKEEAPEQQNWMKIWDCFELKQEAESRGGEAVVNETHANFDKEEELIGDVDTKLRRMQDENLQLKLELENVRLRTELHAAKVELEHVMMREERRCVVM